MSSPLGAQRKRPDTLLRTYDGVGERRRMVAKAELPSLFRKPSNRGRVR